ncbi:conjugal transfer protein TraG N-terminal domain-containing protein [Novosphingobium profundi]|nr:conjugal transfer protein TraG N-terminal domain-containing protein [Novosphingobium profundi]
MDAFSSAVTFGNITMAHSMPSGGGIHSITSQWQSTFPLFLFPQTGVGALKGYLTGFFYLAAWGPLYAVLHMFIMGREESAMAAAAPGGFKMSTMEGIDAVNGDTATIAGFMMMSIPFLAAGLARGAMAVSTQATSMLAPAQAAAEAAAAERTTGNYSYGNQSFQNLTGNVVQRDHWNTAPSFTAGAGMMNYVNENGTKYGVAADGTVIYDNRPGMSNLGFSASMMSSTMGEKTQAASEIESYRRGLQHEMSELLSYGQRRGFSVSSGSRYSSGTETASGVRLGAGTSDSLTNSKGRTEQLAQGRDISQGAEIQRGSSDQYRDQTSTKWGVDARIGVPKLGGGKSETGNGAGAAMPGADGQEGGSKGRGRAAAKRLGDASSAGVSGSYNHETSDGVYLTSNSTSNRADRSTSSASESNRSGEEYAKSSRTSEDQFDSTTNTDRSESFHGVTLTQDEYQDRVRSIADRMTEAEEVQRSLGTTFTAREGGGLQASNDLSQIIASRYADYANSERFRGIAPSLQSTDLTPAQMRARQLIVDEIGKDYIEEIMAPVREHMVSPMEGHDPLPGPGDFSRADLSRVPGGGGGRGVSRPKLDTEGYRDKVGDQIDEGGKSLDASRSAAERSRSSSVIGASDLNQKVDDQLDRRWFEEKGRNR